VLFKIQSIFLSYNKTFTLVYLAKSGTSFIMTNRPSIVDILLLKTFSQEPILIYIWEESIRWKRTFRVEQIKGLEP